MWYIYIYTWYIYIYIYDIYIIFMIYISTINHRSNPWRFPKGLPPRTVEPLAADAPGLPALEMTTEALRELITKWTVESSSDHRGLQGLRNGGRTCGKKHPMVKNMMNIWWIWWYYGDNMIIWVKYMIVGENGDIYGEYMANKIVNCYMWGMYIIDVMGAWRPGINK